MSTTGKEIPNAEPDGWRLLAYMAGDNNLSADMAWALQSMKEYLDHDYADPANTGKNELEVIAQYDPNGLKPRVLKMSKPNSGRHGVVGAKPGEKDGKLDEAVTREITLKETFDDVRNDLEAVSNDRKATSGQQPSNQAALAAFTRDLAASRFADLSTEAMLRTFIAQNLDGNSRQHMLVLSGHGAGVSGDFLTDEDPHSSLMISRLGEILMQTCKKEIDILGIDSCLMGMAEIACEVKGRVHFLVGSEGFVNDSGWPYDRVLNVLAETGDPKSAARGVVEKYAAFYQDYEMAGSSTQIAALDLSKLENLTAAVNKLAQALKSALDSIAADAEKKELEPTSPRSDVRDADAEKKELEPTSARTDGTDVRDAVILAHWYAQSFKWGEYADLWDFCDQLRRFLPNGNFKTQIEEAIEEVKRAVDGVVIRSCYCGPEFQHAHGIAIYFPWSALAVPPSYTKLKFAEATGWHEFLGAYLQKTRRLRRGENGQPPRTFGLDVEGVEKLTRDLGSKTVSHVTIRSGSPSGARSGSPSGARSGSPSGARSGSPSGAKMLGGTLIVPANFQNVPDGYLRQDLSNPSVFTGSKPPVTVSRAKQKARGAAPQK